MAMVVRIDEHTGEVIEVLNDKGWEVPDPKPMAIPGGFQRPATMEERLLRFIRHEVSQAAKDKNYETFEEADDFDVGDDFDPQSPYEVFFDPVLQREVSPDEFVRNEKVYENRYKKAIMKFYEQMDEEEIITENLVRSKHKKKGGPELGGQAGSSGSQLLEGSSTPGTHAKQS